jgi:hypothetical protein
MGETGGWNLLGKKERYGQDSLSMVNFAQASLYYLQNPIKPQGLHLTAAGVEPFYPKPLTG